MEKLSKEELNIIYDALKERYNVLSEIARNGLTTNIKKTATKELTETGLVWGKVERILIEKVNEKVKDGK